MAQQFVRIVLMVGTLLASLALAEKIQFSNEVTPSGTTCYLENIGETIQGKF